MGIIYCYTNTVTGKRYIGQTIHPEQRKRNHLHEAIVRESDYYFHRSIRKHGWDNFTYEILEETDNLSERETFYIKEYNTLWPNGYNQVLEHIGMSDEIRAKISETKKQRFASMSVDERKQSTARMSEMNIGSKRSLETRKKQSEAAKRYLKNNPRVMNEETKKKISESMKKLRSEKFWSTSKKPINIPQQ